VATKGPSPQDELFPVIYRELRRLAGRYLARERRNHAATDGARP
jgi:hypothetical protein